MQTHSLNQNERTKRKRLGLSIECMLVLSVLLAALPASATDTPATTTNASPTRTKDNVEFIIGPVDANAPELKVKEGVPRGMLHEFTMNSEDSKI